MEAWQIRDAGSGIDVQARLQLTRGGLLMEGRAELEYPLVASGLGTPARGEPVYEPGAWVTK